MNKRLVFLCFLIFLVGNQVYSQQTKISGFIKDASNGEALPYVSIRFLESKIGTLSDTSGYFAIESYYGNYLE